MLKPVLLQQHIRVVGMLLICLIGSYMTNAQSYTISPDNGTCIAHVEGGTSPTYTFTASGLGGENFSWSVRGDLAIVSQTTTSVQVRSTGYGKGRLTYNFGQLGCSGFSTSIDLFKTFTSPDSIVGPICVRPGEKVTYSINPIITTTTQISAEIGVDTYTWKINGVDVTGATGWTYSYASGDKSSITVTAPANLTGSPSFR